MNPQGYRGGRGTFGLTGPVPRDIWVLLGIVFFTFSLRFFEATAVLPAILRLGPTIWQKGFVWQLATYPFVGTGTPGIWFVVELLILFLFGRQVLYQLGRRRFWGVLVGIAAGAAVVAVFTQLLIVATTGSLGAMPLVLMQGQRMLLAILIAVFAVLNREATILLFFVLPVQAKWFLLLEIVFAFLGFLSTHDLAGFLGVCAAVGATVLYLRPRSARGGLREVWLRMQQGWFRFRLAWLRRRRGFKVVRGEKPGGDDPWVH
jgi:hypothetical protein